MGDYGDAFMRNKDAAVQARTKAQNRATVLQLKLIGQSHPTGLTSNLLKLFEPRPPLEYKPPPEKRKLPLYTGMAQFVQNFAEPGDTEYAPPVPHVETPTQRRARIHRLRLEKGAEKAAKELEKYDPSKDPNMSGDPYKTLFVARLSYETTEHKIKREFEVYGPIKRVRLVNDTVTNKPRGYAFVEYMHTRDMKTAYKQADGRKIDNKRVLVDVERGRTVPNWRPRRLGGGLGSTRVGGEEVNQKYSGREPQLLSAGQARIEEPKIREERHDDRERDNERERDRDRDRKEREREPERPHELSRERSHERSRGRDRDRDYDHDRDRDIGREHDRYHRDRDRDRGERDRERGERDKDRGERDKDRERGRDRERHRDRERDRPRDKERDRDHIERSQPRDKERDRDHIERSQPRDKERDRDHIERSQPRDKERDRDHIERSHSHDYELER